MDVVPRPLDGPKLVRDFLAGEASAAPFYEASPFAPDSYRRKAASLASDARERARDAAALVEPGSPSSKALLRDVARSGGYFVTTGQQPGLFGGPLYGLYKALAAVRLAEDLGRLLDKPVMPLFWIASDDHDWEEAGRAYALDGANRLRRLELGRPGPGPGRRSLAETPMGEGLEEAVAGLADAFPPNDFREHWLGQVRQAYQPGATLPAAFRRFMEALLQDTPLGWVDAGDPRVKAASRPLLEAEAKDPAASDAVLAETGTALRAAGYGLQVPLIPGAANLFVHAPDGRDRLERAGAGFRLRRSGRELSTGRVLELIAADRCAVSANVLLRPVVESFLFPTLAYVGGPGELAYFGQLRGLFQRHGVGMPVATPRASLLVVEAKVAKAMEALGVEPADLKDRDGLLARFARQDMPPAVEAAGKRWRDEVHSASEELTAAVAGVDPTLEGAAKTARNASLAALAALDKKIVRALKRRNETARDRIDKARANLWPAGKPQDRIFGPLQYLVRYGSGFVDLVRRRLQVASSDWKE